MNFLKKLAGRFMACWALLVFAASMILFLLPIWITGLWKEPQRTIYVFRVFHVWMKFFFVLSGVRRKLYGRNQFRKGKAYIVVCNHNSFMDVPLSSPGIPGANKTIAKVEMARIPVFGMVYSRGSVLVDRKSEESRRASYSRMKDVLDMGLHMCIYPEGTRNKTREPLQRFHDGAFKLATETGKEIIPAVIFHTSKVLPANIPFFFWPRPVEMHFLAPISPAGKSTQALKEEVFEVMKNYYLEHNN